MKTSTAPRFDRALSLIRSFRDRGYSIEAAFVATAIVLELDSAEFGLVHAAAGL